MSRPRATVEEFWSRVDRSGGDGACWLWTGRVNSGSLGYGMLKRNGLGVYAHRYAYMVSVGEIPDGAHVMHRCDVPLCCNPAHLSLGSARDNKRDCIDKRRHSFGQQHHKAKLTDEQVAELRKEYATMEADRLAEKYGISRTGVHRLTSWKFRNDAGGPVIRKRRVSYTASA